MCESTTYQYRRDFTYTVPYVPAIAFCANARPRTLGTLPDDASRLMRGVPTQRLVGLRPPPCVVPPRKLIGFRQRTETRKPPSWHTKAHEISRINELQPQKGIFRVISCRALGPCSCPADVAPAGGGGGGATGEASPQAMSRRHCRMLPQGNATFAGFVVARQRPPSY
jgi:hypothetical protein